MMKHGGCHWVSERQVGSTWTRHSRWHCINMVSGLELKKSILDGRKAPYKAITIFKPEESLEIRTVIRKAKGNSKERWASNPKDRPEKELTYLPFSYPCCDIYAYHAKNDKHTSRAVRARRPTELRCSRLLPPNHYIQVVHSHVACDWVPQHKRDINSWLVRARAAWI